MRQKFVETEGQHAAGCAAPEEGCPHFLDELQSVFYEKLTDET